MTFTFEYRASDSPLIDMIWRTRSEGGGMFTSTAAAQCEMVITKQQGKLTLSVRGPETRASPSPIPEDAEFFGIAFKLGTFMPNFPTLVDDALHLPESVRRSFLLHGSVWEFPTYENADTFINRLVRDGLLAHEPIVDAALQGQLPDLSLRSVQRRFLRATGLTHTTVFQIQRAHRAADLLRQGLPILDVVEQAGYTDQPHLTRALKRYMGQTPAQILRKCDDLILTV
jgi:AraC-like DNA-binding protein